jgi:signal transduction histidine kinase
MNILVVDDAEMVRYVLTEKLVESGFSVESACDGASAVEIFQRSRFDAVLLDLKMPGMDGIETLKELLKRDPDVPVIMVTAFGDIATAVEAIKLGAYDFVEKPPQISRIVLTIRHALEKATLERELKNMGKNIAETSALKQANQKLMELDRIKTAFLSSISHEMRTPLTSLIGYAEINRSKIAKIISKIQDAKAVKDIGQVEENLDIMITEAKRLTELIDNVLELTAMEAGTADWKWSQVQVNEILKQALNTHSLQFSQKGIVLTTETAEDLPEIRGDINRLNQVLGHLLSNALKFTDNGAVTCRAVNSGNSIVITVTDTGKGIDESLHRVIFDKCRQLGDTLTEKPKGVGLGLPLSKLIIEYHGGFLSVASEPEKGSIFTITLPCVEEVSR